MRDILHRSDHVEVRRVRAGDGRRIVVTFDPYHDDRGFDRPGFGEAHFAKEGISAIHVLSRDNDWFQYPDMVEALALIRSAAAGAERRLTYGSSMGGYAAVRFAEAVGATAVLALSPQYSVDRRKAPFERRWMQDQRRIRFVGVLEQPIRFAGPMVIAYDPLTAADRLHVERIASETATLRLPLPHAGHPSGPVLAETGLLGALVTDVLDGTFDRDWLLAQVHARRSTSATLLGNLAAQQPPYRLRLAVALAEKAATIAPLDPAVLDRLALQLAAAGDAERAIEAHRRVIAQAPLPNYLWGFSKTLFAAGQRAEALAVARQLQRAAPTVAGFHRWAAEIALALGDRRAALADIRRAIRCAPANRGYWRMALRLALSPAPRP